MRLTTALVSIEDFYRRIYWHVPGVVTQGTPAYTLTYSGSPWLHSINQLWLHRADALDDGLLAVAHDFFSRDHAEYSIVFTEAGHSPRISWLAERHYAERYSSPIYALSGLPRSHYSHREARIERACAEQQQELLQVMYGVFFIGPEIGRRIVSPEHFADPTIRHYLAYVGREAAACATIMLHDGLAGVWNVGTLRPFRRQGLAAAILMRALVEAAADGCPDSVLVASPMGRSLYEEMGYQFLGTTYSYGPPE
jgi:GNAT superfamily N-acetyltransferase